MNATSFFNAGPVAPRTAVLAALALSLAVSGCTRTDFGNASALQPAPQQPQPVLLTPAPTPPVSGSRLPDAVPQSPTAVAGSPAVDTVTPGLDSRIGGTGNTATPAVQQASVTPTDAGQPVTEQALVGAWTVAVGGGACQIFMTLTNWSGGKRAAVKGCAGTDVADVQAWNLRGRQIVLVDRSGSTAATLYRSGDTRYDGSTSLGKAISFTR